MIKYRPTVPKGCQVIGGLYESSDRSLMGEDMLEVVLPNGILVSAGWYPEGDASGRYRIVATEGFECIRQLEADDVQMANYIVQSLVFQLTSEGWQAMADASYQKLECCA